MTIQKFIDLLDEKIQSAISKMVAGTKDEFEKYQAEIQAYKNLKRDIKSKIKKEAKRGMAER